MTQHKKDPEAELVINNTNSIRSSKSIIYSPVQTNFSIFKNHYYHHHHYNGNSNSNNNSNGNIYQVSYSTISFLQLFSCLWRYFASGSKWHNKMFLWSKPYSLIHSSNNFNNKINWKWKKKDKRNSVSPKVLGTISFCLLF